MGRSGYDTSAFGAANARPAHKPPPEVPAGKKGKKTVAVNKRKVGAGPGVYFAPVSALLTPPEPIARQFDGCQQEGQNGRCCPKLVQVELT